MIDLALSVQHKAHHDGEPYTVRVSVATLIAAEEHFDTTAQEMFAPVSLSRLAWIAWRQTTADATHGPVQAKFELWREGLVALDAAVDDAPLDEAP